MVVLEVLEHQGPQDLQDSLVHLDLLEQTETSEPLVLRVQQVSLEPLVVQEPQGLQERPVRQECKDQQGALEISVQLE